MIGGALDSGNELESGCSALKPTDAPSRFPSSTTVHSCLTPTGRPATSPHLTSPLHLPHAAAAVAAPARRSCPRRYRRDRNDFLPTFAPTCDARPSRAFPLPRSPPCTAARPHDSISTHASQLAPRYLDVYTSSRSSIPPPSLASPDHSIPSLALYLTPHFPRSCL